MIDNVFKLASIAETHADLFRNIVSLRTSENLFDDLSDDPGDWETAISVELNAKPHTFVSHIPVIYRPFEEADWNDAINYPFKNWTRSRFSDGSFGIWYGCDQIETTVHETAYHWRNSFLLDAGFAYKGIKIDRKIYSVRCDAALIDLRHAATRFPDLTNPNDYTFTQQIGGRLHREGHPGLTSKSARFEGDCYAVLNPKVLSNPRQSCLLTYVTTDTGITIERQPGVTWFEIPAEE